MHAFPCLLQPTNGLNAINQRLTRPPIGEMVEASQAGDRVLLASLLGIVRDGWALALITRAGRTRFSKSSGGVGGHIWHPVSILEAISHLRQNQNLPLLLWLLLLLWLCYTLCQHFFITAGSKPIRSRRTGGNERAEEEKRKIPKAQDYGKHCYMGRPYCSMLGGRSDGAA
jgi:hypothetical protein